MKQILLYILVKAGLSLVISFVFASVNWIWGMIIGKDKDFLLPFLGGAAAIFLFMIIIRIPAAIKAYKIMKDGR